MTEPRLTVVALTEDTADDAVATLVALLKSMMRSIAPGARMDLVRFEPPQKVAHRAVRANRWKSARREDRQGRVDLLRTIATDVMRSNCVVAFHFDGDVRWSERERSENMQKFQDIIVIGVRQLLVGPRMTNEKIDRALQRLIAIVPFYTLEAWLYQNTRRAIELCKQHHDGEHVTTFQGWADNRHELDELEKPWAFACLGKSHNRDLAETSFPASEVRAVEKSFAAAIAALQSNSDLIAVLEHLQNISP